MSALPAPIEVFYSYADGDEPLCLELDKHLSQLRRDGLIVAFYKRQITAGRNWTKALDQHLNRASVILLLISSDFVASDASLLLPRKPSLTRSTNRLIVPLCAGFSNVLRALISCTFALAPAFNAKFWGCMLSIGRFFVCLVLHILNSIFSLPKLRNVG